MREYVRSHLFDSTGFGMQHEEQAGTAPTVGLRQAAAYDAMEAMGAAVEQVARAQRDGPETVILLGDALDNVRAAANSLRFALADARRLEQQDPSATGTGR
ncbi:hypothetical protein [Micromonospora sp. NPDC051141]|uniref:hypothetical protein n=1 Tax=Micromonospora sp. NPDC051141 TaxID=3364284 RepID=UPI0037B98A54